MWLARCIASLGLALIAGQLAPAAESVLPQPLRTSQRSFVIPFDLDLLDLAGSEPREVRLLVSDDAGRTWNASATVQPDVGHFDFCAPEEGEYWFVVKTVDSDGKVWPQAITRPEMRVVVEPVRAIEPVVVGFPTGRMPAHERARMVNSLSFEIDYDVQAADAANPGRVELWWTGDGGQSWRLFGNDDDQQSPMLVTVDREGLYGFWLVIESERGVRGNRPKADDLPQIWVGVDTTPPAARLLSVELKPADGQQQLTIRWEANDALLSAKPVALSYSATRKGPWQSLETELDNRGVYQCLIPSGGPAEIFVHLEVRDEAGNSSSVEPIEPCRSAAIESPGLHARSWLLGSLYR